MENLFRIKEFLSNRCIKDYYEMSFIFGSIAKGNKYPNDCDLFWVTNCQPETVPWEKMREYVQLVKSDFYNEFELKLNVTINTLNEFKEGSEFKSRILSRPIIKIKNGIQHFV